MGVELTPADFERTLNGTGYAIRSLDLVSQAFVEFAATSRLGPVLEVGAAFGAATLRALARGAQVIANDIDPRHLDILWSRAAEADRQRLTLLPGEFPDHVNVPPSSVSGILIARVLHFFDGPQLERAAAAAFRWLAPQGKVFVVTDASPFLRQPALRRRLEEQLRRGDRWPGFVANVPELVPDKAADLPQRLHFLSPQVLTRTFQLAGFEIETIRWLERSEQAPRGILLRRSVGLVAKKSSPVTPDKAANSSNKVR